MVLERRRGDNDRMAPLDPLPALLGPWQNFYILVGTAAATLTGLMFVAVTFGSSLVTRDTAEMSRAFLDPTYEHFGQVLLTACVMTMPVLPAPVLAALLILVGVLRLMSLQRVFGHYLEAHRKHRDVEFSDWVTSIVVPGLCHLGLLLTGVAFALRLRFAVVSLAVLTLILLAIGIQSAWELFVWMALAVNERRGKRDEQALGAIRKSAAPETSD
jgi:hypothetical protein